MKLLFDQNCSPRPVDRLAGLYPGSSHVAHVSLDRSLDEDVWNYARDNGYCIITKDADFGDLSLLRGFPPKVIWLRLGNCTSRQIEATLRIHHQAIEALEADPTAGVLTLL